MSTSSRKATMGKIAAWLVAVFAVLGLFVIGGAQRASAAGNGLYSISPANIPGQSNRQYMNYLVDPGSTVRDAVTVVNQTNSPLPLRLYPADGVNAQGGGFALLTPNKKMREVGKWTQLSDTEFTLPAKSLATVPIYINVPPNVSPGDYAGGIVVRPVNPAIEKRHNLTFAVYQAVGTRIYIRIKGPLHPRLEVTNLAVHPSTSVAGLFGGPTGVNVTYTFKNTGNEILNPTALLKLSPSLGGSTTFSPQRFSSILPGNSVTITRHASGVEPLLHLSASLTIKATKPLEPTVAASASAWVVPWLGILALAILAALVYLLLRRRRGQSPPVPPATGDTPSAPAAVGAGKE